MLVLKLHPKSENFKIALNIDYFGKIVVLFIL